MHKFRQEQLDIEISSYDSSAEIGINTKNEVIIEKKKITDEKIEKFISISNNITNNLKLKIFLSILICLATFIILMFASNDDVKKNINVVAVTTIGALNGFFFRGLLSSVIESHRRLKIIKSERITLEKYRAALANFIKSKNMV